jgi:hypothetical protein
VEGRLGPSGSRHGCPGRGTPYVPTAVPAVEGGAEIAQDAGALEIAFVGLRVSARQFFDWHFLIWHCSLPLQQSAARYFLAPVFAHECQDQRAISSVKGCTKHP